MTMGRLTPLLVGKCPDDWQQVFIDEVTELLTNGYVGPSLPFQTDDPAVGVRYLQGFNVRPNKIEYVNATWVTKEFHEKNQKVAFVKVIFWWFNPAILALLRLFQRQLLAQIATL